MLYAIDVSFAFFVEWEAIKQGQLMSFNKNRKEEIIKISIGPTEERVIYRCKCFVF